MVKCLALHSIPADRMCGRLCHSSPCGHRISHLVQALAVCNKQQLTIYAIIIVLLSYHAAPKIWNSLPLYLSVTVPVQILSIVTSRPSIASRPSSPLNPFFLCARCGFLLTMCAFMNYIYLHTYGCERRIVCVKVTKIKDRFSCDHC